MLEIFLPGVELGKEHLVQNLRGAQVAHQPADGGGAEGAALAAADLRGDADRVAVLVAHHHGLHGVAVAQFPEILDGPVDGGDLLAQELSAHRGKALLQLFAQVLGEIGHPLKAAHAAAKPLEDLAGAKARLAQGGKLRLQLLRQQGEDIRFSAFSHGLSDSPSQFRGKKAVRAVDIRPEGVHAAPVLDAADRSKASAHIPGALPERRGPRPRFPPPGRCRWNRAARRPALHSGSEFSRIAPWISGRPGCSRVFCADLRLLGDHAEAGAGHVRDHKVKALSKRRVKALASIAPGLDDADPEPLRPASSTRSFFS